MNTEHEILREIAELEADPESWRLAYREAVAFQTQLEREQGSATQRILAKLGQQVER